MARNLLDDVDLIVTGGGEDDGELGLLLGLPPRRHRHPALRQRQPGRCRDAPLLLELLHQLRRFQDGEGGETIHNLIQVGHGLELASLMVLDSAQQSRTGLGYCQCYWR